MTGFDDKAVRVLEEAEVLKLHCRHKESIDLLEGLLSRDPANVAALEELADNELSLGMYERALKAAKQAVALDKNSFIGYYVIGFVASHRSDWGVAVEALCRANKLQSSNPEILRCFGLALFHHGEKVQGIVTLERALNLDPDHPLTLCDLGACYLEVQNFQKAHSLFSRVLELDPVNPHARKCLDMLDKMHGAVR